MKIVIDTNVIASAMFFGGRPRELLELLVSHKLDAYATADIITGELIIFPFFNVCGDESSAAGKAKSIRLLFASASYIL
jgi:predicted nucleic acid-binding protein